MNAPQPNQRYSLKLTHYENADAMREAAFIIYQSATPTLVATLGTLPYTVGRTFSYQELAEIHEKLKSIAVGHRFESTDGVSQVISFHPGDEKRDEEITLIRKKRKIHRGAIAGLSVFGAVLVVGGFALYLTRPHSTPDSNAKQSVARISEVTAQVQRRTSGDVNWLDAKENDALYERDSLRTFEQSNALLTYQEGSTLYVRENSLIVIELPTNSRSREIQLEDGTLQAKLRKASEPYQFTIHTKAGTLIAKSPTADSEGSIQTTMKDGKLAVAVESGEVQLQSSKGNFDLKPAERIEIAEDSEPQIKPFTADVDVLTPPQGAKLTLAPFVFEVTPILNANRYVWIFGSTKDMRTILLVQKTDVPSLTLQYLDPGEIFWKVEVEADGLISSSPVRQLHVQ